ncbi:MAG: hypothetical protein AABM67_05185 [Acidobacteriota bacterium]
MKSQFESNEEIRRFLLGTLSPEEAAEFEERLLGDSELYEELSVAEDELIDQFLSGEMPAFERERMETHFLRTPERMKQLSFARTLRNYVSANKLEGPARELKPEKKPSFWSTIFSKNPGLAYSLAVALLLVLVGGVWFTGRLLNRPTQPQTVWAIELTPGLQRDDAEIKSFSIPATVDTIRLELDLAEDQYPAYQAEVQDIEGRSVTSSKNLKAQTANARSIVAVDVKAALLEHGDYRAKLSGVPANGNLANLGSYPFKVLGK